MLRTPHSGIALALSVAFLSAPHTSRAQVDTALIPRILGDELSHPFEIDEEKSKKMLDSMSNSATKRLDQNNQAWNASAPKWKAVYDRVHADLELEMPSIREAVKSEAQKQQQDGEADIAARLSQSDVDAILAYYTTPEGQRYQEFAQRVDKIMSSGMGNLASLRATSNEQHSATKPTPEQTTRYTRLLTLSRPYQSIVAASQAQKDPSGYGGVIGFGMGLAIRKSQQELEALDNEYAADLTNFEAFTKTDAEQHLFAAMGQAMLRMGKDTSLVGFFQAVEQKHESDWTALYLAQGPP